MHGKTSNDNCLLSKKGDFVASSSSEPVFNSVITQIRSLAENLETFPKNVVKNNISIRERKALEDLANNDDIVIKKVDKGSSIVIMDKEYYINKVNECVFDKSTYKKLSKNKDSTVMNRVKNLMNKYKTCFDEKGKEFKYVCNFDYMTSNFYGLPKIHKSEKLKEILKSFNGDFLEITELPDLTFRFITAGPSAPTSKLSELIDMLLKPFLVTIPSYIRDTTDFLNKICKLKTNYKNGRLITADIKSMYPSINRDLGYKAVRYFLAKYPDLLPKRFDVEFIIEALQIILENSNFQFNGNYFCLKSGTATGTALAPTFANLVMAYLEIQFYKKVENKFGSEISLYVIQNWFRFIDDGFIVWNDDFGNYIEFLEILNDLDPHIKFTHDSSKEGLSFLNVYLYFENGELLTDIFYKETDSHYYLPFNSCHPRHVKISLPNNLARIICTIVEDPIKKESRLEELKGWLLKCGYPLDLINNGINKVRQIDQQLLRENSISEEENVLVFVQTHNPKNPNVFSEIIKSLDFLMCNPKYKNIFSNLKIIKSEKQNKNLGQILQKSNIGNEKPIHGCFKCNRKKCGTCKYLLVSNEVNFPKVNKTFKLHRLFSCNSNNLIYKITCNGCQEYYIGQTYRLKQRLNNHKFNIINDAYRSQKVHKHIDTCAKHLKVPFSIIPLYICKKDTKVNRLATESYFIRKYKPTLNSF